jgi:hypothetical protein
MRIPQYTVFPRAFAFADFARFALSALVIEEHIVLFSTHDELSCIGEGQGQPGIACKAPIPNMNNLFPPQGIDFVQNASFNRIALLDLTAHKPSGVRLSGFSITLSSQRTKTSSPAACNASTRCVPCCHSA